MVQINFQPEVVAKLEQKDLSKYHILLDLEDGTAFDERHALSCSFDVNFRLLLVPKEVSLPDFYLMVDSNLGPIGVKKNSQMYLDSNLKLTQKAGSSAIILQNDSGIIDSNVPVKIVSGE
ncbi:iron-sulfur cluster biosynthesis family protein [Lactobacillus sp. DCY120]|uniref:Iron-sulfur cluster biosynthesis family protein n=1 Tax=Bombilactobacillus apium TaxID=2675299 RepID=A0A850R0I3_9LACO|nr:iron-sulfur cluster biosynthesis family protein [Bombilactobacillus apium]NVY96433.1 iron-sulfur cluster biosynthesis family protein [Bombilactobacillus apium]